MWKRSLTVLLGIGVSLLPKLACPLWWLAYAGLLSALGLGFLISARYLLPLTVAFLAIASTAVGFRASRRRGYGPFWLGLVAAAVILTGKFYFKAEPLTWAFSHFRLLLLLGCAKRGRFWQVPLDAYPRIERGGIVLKSAKNLDFAPFLQNRDKPRREIFFR